MTAIKICGITRGEDAELAAGLGVQALGFVLWPGSPRAIALDAAAAIIRDLPPLVMAVAVLVDPAADEVARTVRVGGFSAVQIHGRAPTWSTADPAPCRVVRAVCLAEADGAVEPPVEHGMTVLLDAHDPVRHGGSGRVIDWSRAAGVAARRRTILAGGLTPANVGDAIRTVRPYGVDVASGVEARPGVKNEGALRAFVDAVRNADGRSDACQ